LANSKLLTALFASDSTERKRNTEAVELGPNQLVSARIVDYSPARSLPYETVKDRVREQFMATRSAELAKQDGASKLSAWMATPATATFPEAVTVSRQDPKTLPMPVLEAAMRADGQALPQQAGVDLGPAGYAIVKVVQILPREAPKADAAKQELAQYTREWTTAENVAYYDVLKEQFKALILVAKPK
jgi:peptidyl-prolyl cis-trans isomerase D